MNLDGSKISNRDIEEALRKMAENAKTYKAAQKEQEEGSGNPERSDGIIRHQPRR